MDRREPPWAINGPLTNRDERSRRAVIALVVLLVDGVERGVQVVGDGPNATIRYMTSTSHNPSPVCSSFA